MTFADRYLTFDIRIADIGRGIDSRFFTKTPLHPQTEQIEIFSRVIAHVIKFEEGLELSVGAFEPDLPSSFKKDLFGKYGQTVFLNERHSDRIDKLLRHNRDALAALFFTDQKAKAAYIHSLRGHIPETINRVECFEFTLPQSTAAFAESDLSRFRFDVVISEGFIYITMGGESDSFEIGSFDLKEEYQRSLLKGSVEKL